METRIRLAEARDCDGLRGLYRELDADAVRHQPEHFVMSERTDAYLLDRIRARDSDFIVAERDGRLLGFSLVSIKRVAPVSCLKPQVNAYIGDLVVTRSERGHGIGTALMEASKRYGRERGAEFIRTQVFPGNEAGIRFYARNGFVETMKTMECPFGEGGGSACD